MSFAFAPQQFTVHGPFQRKLDTTLALDEDPRLSNWVCDVFRTCRCEENITRIEHCLPVYRAVLIQHANNSTTHDEHLFAIINMLLVRLIRPMKPCGNTAHVRDVQCAPCSVGFEVSATYNLHNVSNGRAPPPCQTRAAVPANVHHRSCDKSWRSADQCAWPRPEIVR